MDEKIIELKDTIKDLLQNIVKRIDDISGDNGVTENHDTDRLVNLFDDLQALAEGIDIIREFYADIDIMEFQEKIDMIKRAMEAQDMMLLSDLLKYELRGLLDYWTKCLSK